ncbi:MAG: hypothetical protein ACM3X9_08365 [Bacillota bacterium]
MNQRYFLKTGKQNIDFKSGGRVKRVFFQLFLVIVGINLVVVLLANLINLLGKTR